MRRHQAGAAAEEQMSFYLRRAFGDAGEVVVINDLRLVEEDDFACGGRAWPGARLFFAGRQATFNREDRKTVWNRPAGLCV